MCQYTLLVHVFNHYRKSSYCWDRLTTCAAELTARGQTYNFNRVILLGPALRPEQRHEHTASAARLQEPIAFPRNDGKPLLTGRPDRNDEAASAGRQLALQRRGHARRSRGNENAVKGCVRFAAQRAVADEHEDVRVAERREPRPRRVGELGD